MSFSDFTVRDWRIFSGHCAMVICCLLYSVWWASVFDTGEFCVGPLLQLLPMVIAALASMVLLIHGSFSGKGRDALPLYRTVACCAALYAVLALVARFVFHVTVTEALLAMVLWLIAELCALDSLVAEGLFSATKRIIMLIVIILSFVLSFVCYLQFFMLPVGVLRITGFIPPALYGIVAGMFMFLQAT